MSIIYKVSACEAFPGSGLSFASQLKGDVAEFRGA